jgi:hypothetical protein
LVVIAPGSSDYPVLDQVPADDEHELQERMKSQPELLPLEDLGIAGSGIVVGRETYLLSGAVDLVILGYGGELCLIEFKTGPANPDFRAALAQLIGYGSSLWGKTVDEFDALVTGPYFGGRHCPVDSPGRGATSLEEVVKAAWPQDEERDAFDWKDRLTTQLSTGGFRYVVVAQRFTEPMLQTIRYLNSTMPAARFYAVELVRFAHPSGFGAYEARLLLGPEPSRGGDRAKALTGSTELLGRIADDAYRIVLEEFLTGLAQLTPLSIYYGTTGVSFRVQITGRPPISIGWLFPPGAPRWLGLTDLTLGYWHDKLDIDEIRRHALEQYASKLAELPGAVRAKPSMLNASTYPPAVVTDLHTQLVPIVQELVTALTA